MFRSLRQRCFAALYDPLMRGYQRHIRARKAELFTDLYGDVVEIGPGTGANLEFLPPGTHWTGVEPNPHMHAKLIQRAKERGVQAGIVTASAERIQLDDACCDAVIGSLVLCSIPDVPATLSEIHRILRPGGCFLFIEHVAAPTKTLLRTSQDLLNPCWRMFVDGCNLNRDTEGMLRSSPFADLHTEQFRVPTPPALPVVSPHIAGAATK